MTGLIDNVFIELERNWATFQIQERSRPVNAHNESRLRMCNALRAINENNDIMVILNAEKLLLKEELA